jgi:hypothetical protein
MSIFSRPDTRQHWSIRGPTRDNIPTQASSVCQALCVGVGFDLLRDSGIALGVGVGGGVGVNDVDVEQSLRRRGGDDRHRRADRCGQGRGGAG